MPLCPKLVLEWDALMRHIPTTCLTPARWTKAGLHQSIITVTLEKTSFDYFVCLSVGWFSLPQEFCQEFYMHYFISSSQLSNKLDSNIMISKGRKKRLGTLPKFTPFIRAEAMNLNSCLKNPWAHALASASDPGRWVSWNRKWAEKSLPSHQSHVWITLLKYDILEDISFNWVPTIYIRLKIHWLDN